MSVSAVVDTEKIQREAKALEPWFHNLHLPGGVETLGTHPYYGDFPARKWNKIAPLLPADMTGLTALDIGCNAGFYSFELARRGARVTALDVDEHYLKQARWAADKLGLVDRVTFRQGQVYDLAREIQPFDVVLFLGVFYHLRYPQLALDIVCGLTRKHLVFQTLTMPGEDVFSAPEDVDIADRSPLVAPGWPAMAFIENKLAGDPTNWWAPNHAAVLALLRSSGMRVAHQPGDEMYVCEPDPTLTPYAQTWGRTEFESATGIGTRLGETTA